MIENSYCSVHWSCAVFRNFVLLVFLVVVSGCTNLNYSTAIKKFAVATDEAQTAMTGLNEIVTREYEAVLKDKILATNGSRLVRSDKECRTKSTRCRLEIASNDDETNGKRLPPEPILNDLVELMSYISAYVRDLDALAKVRDAAEVHSNVNAAIGNIQNLAKTLKKLGQNSSITVSAFTTPVGSVVNWVIGTYTETVKICGLRHATDNADPVIQNAAQYFATAGVLAARVKATRFSEALEAELKVQRLTKQGIDRAVAAAKKYDLFLRANPDAVFQKLANAHSALRKSLNGSGISFAQLVSNIEEFAKLAQELAKVVKDSAKLHTS